MITNEELIYAITKSYAGAKYCENFWVGTMLGPDRLPVRDAEILQWDLPTPAPTDILALVSTHPMPPKIPQAVTAAQWGIALIRMGFMAAVEAVISNMRQDPTTYAEVLWAWDRATVWERSSSSLNTLATAAGITQSQMDDLFVLAATIAA